VALQQSVKSEALLHTLQNELASLEALCAEIERALMGRDWKRLDTAIADSRRITHALQNAFEAAQPVRTEEFDTQFMRRLRYVFAVRESQMARLQQYHAAVDDRLQTLTRWQQALRSIAKRSAPQRRAGLDRLT
jgi:hypothetical protein